MYLILFCPSFLLSPDVEGTISRDDASGFGAYSFHKWGITSKHDLWRTTRSLLWRKGELTRSATFALRHGGKGPEDTPNSGAHIMSLIKQPV